jgi:hypothetical protein
VIKIITQEKIKKPFEILNYLNEKGILSDEQRINLWESIFYNFYYSTKDINLKKTMIKRIITNLNNTSNGSDNNEITKELFNLEAYLNVLEDTLQKKPNERILAQNNGETLYDFLKDYKKQNLPWFVNLNLKYIKGQEIIFNNEDFINILLGSYEDENLPWLLKKIYNSRIRQDKEHTEENPIKEMNPNERYVKLILFPEASLYEPKEEKSNGENVKLIEILKKSSEKLVELIEPPIQKTKERINQKYKEIKNNVTEKVNKQKKQISLEMFWNNGGFLNINEITKRTPEEEYIKTAYNISDIVKGTDFKVEEFNQFALHKLKVKNRNEAKFNYLWNKPESELKDFYLNTNKSLSEFVYNSDMCISSNTLKQLVKEKLKEELNINDNELRKGLNFRNYAKKKNILNNQNIIDAYINSNKSLEQIKDEFNIGLNTSTLSKYLREHYNVNSRKEAIEKFNHQIDLK